VYIFIVSFTKFVRSAVSPYRVSAALPTYKLPTHFLSMDRTALLQCPWSGSSFPKLLVYLLAYKDGTDSVPKGRHIKFRRRGITQKKTYSIQNTAKV
jgi:hypothetical protein